MGQNGGCASLSWEGAGAQDGLRCAPHLHSMLAGLGRGSCLLMPYAHPQTAPSPCPRRGRLEAQHFPQMVGNLTERGGAVCPHLWGPRRCPAHSVSLTHSLTWVWWHRGALGRAPFPIAHAGGTGNNSLSTVLYGFQEGNKWPPVSPIFLLRCGTEP